jgi:hypothetical protein
MAAGEQQAIEVFATYLLPRERGVLSENIIRRP